jgi:hypothetical protein
LAQDLDWGQQGRGDDPSNPSWSFIPRILQFDLARNRERDSNEFLSDPPAGSSAELEIEQPPDWDSQSSWIDDASTTPASAQARGEAPSQSIPQRFVQSTLDSAPGAYYGRLALDEFRAGSYGRAAGYEAAALADAAAGLLSLGAASIGGAAARRAATALANEARGGAYLLRHPGTGQVMRTGRTKSFIRREAEHLQHPTYKQFKFERVFSTDIYAEQRGLEQYLHDLHNPPFNFRTPIHINNPRRQEYLDAARRFLNR